jgi:cob(I)alamin adenosyltransferase
LLSGAVVSLVFAALLAAYVSRPIHRLRQALRDAADTVSDIGMEKHAFQSGIKAMPGLEF